MLLKIPYPLFEQRESNKDFDVNISLNTDRQLLTIPGPAGVLEALIETPHSPASKKIAILCHPHPLHEGTMNNKVVTTLARACQALGAVVVRFNFRGVGASAGVYDNAIGEQEDLKAVIRWAHEHYPESGLWLAGFSFGSYVATKVASEMPVDQLIAIAPPVNHFDFSSLPAITCPWLIVQGESDEIVPATEVFAWAASRPENPQVIRLPNVGHFFHGKLIELRDDIIAACTPSI